MRVKYPLERLRKISGTEADERYTRLFQEMPIAPAAPACIAFSPAHLHIDILPEYQRQGLGKLLISRAMNMKGVWVGLDPKNANARGFYQRLGFEDITDAPELITGLLLTVGEGNDINFSFGPSERRYNVITLFSSILPQTSCLVSPSR